MKSKALYVVLCWEIKSTFLYTERHTHIYTRFTITNTEYAHKIYDAEKNVAKLVLLIQTIFNNIINQGFLSLTVLKHLLSSETYVYILNILLSKKNTMTMYL